MQYNKLNEFGGLNEILNRIGISIKLLHEQNNNIELEVNNIKRAVNRIELLKNENINEEIKNANNRDNNSDNNSDDYDDDDDDYDDTNITLNRKGATAYKSSLHPILDLFTYTSLHVTNNIDDFEQLCLLIQQAMSYNLELFIKLLMLHRNIKIGNGIKHIYYLSLIILKLHYKNNDFYHLYQYILSDSFGYAKDMLRLMKINRELYISFEEELILYSTLVYDVIKDIIVHNKKEVNLMLFKYLSYETGQFKQETKQIWTKVNELINNDIIFIQCVDDTQLTLLQDKKEYEIQFKLLSLLKKSLKVTDSVKSIHLTNKTIRNIKTLFNQHINLTDNMFKGIHNDGTLFGTHTDINDEIKMVYNVLVKTPTLSFKHAQKTILKRHDKTDIVSTILVKALDMYHENVKNKTITVKTHGLNIVEEVYNYYIKLIKNINDVDVVLETQINTIINDIKDYIYPLFTDSQQASLFRESLLFILDISGSMHDVPLNTGLFYMLVMVKIFNLTELYYFESNYHVVSLTESDITGPLNNLITKIYKSTCGSTNLNSILQYFDKKQLTNKNVIICTDGDCDPSRNNKSPFHDIAQKSKYLNTHNYIVLNVNQSTLKFPYLFNDIRVCYLTGNNPKQLNGFIKALVYSTINNVPITPELILKYCLDYITLNDNILNSINTFKCTTLDDHSHTLLLLHRVFMQNISISKTQKNKTSENENNKTNIIKHDRRRLIRGGRFIKRR